MFVRVPQTHLGTTCRPGVEEALCQQAWSREGRDGACLPRTRGIGPGRRLWSSPGAPRHTQAPGDCTSPWTQCPPTGTKQQTARTKHTRSNENSKCILKVMPWIQHEVFGVRMNRYWPLWRLSEWGGDAWSWTGPREGCRRPARSDPTPHAGTGSAWTSHCTWPNRAFYQTTKT